MSTAYFAIAEHIAKLLNRSSEEMIELVNNMIKEIPESKSSLDLVRTYGQKKYSENNEINIEKAI